MLATLVALLFAVPNLQFDESTALHSLLEGVQLHVLNGRPNNRGYSFPIKGLNGENCFLILKT